MLDSPCDFWDPEDYVRVWKKLERLNIKWGVVYVIMCESS